MTDGERKQVLTTLQDFSSIAKSGTLNNLFLMSFAELVERKQNKSIQTDELLNQMDVLMAILEKVRLKRENYLTLMENVKVFIDDRLIQKKGYKVLSKVIERFELQNLDEVAEIKAKITPIMSFERK